MSHKIGEHVSKPSIRDLIRRIESLGFEVHAWRNESIDGHWLPRLAASKAGFLLWEHTGTRDYPFPHYSVCWRRQFGGAHRELHNAVAWLDWMSRESSNAL